MANKFLNTVEWPIIKACYDILQLPIRQSSIKKGFIMTCRLDEWVFIAKDKNMTTITSQFWRCQIIW